MGRILVIDDDPDIGALVRLKLEMAGHLVQVESDGVSGLQRAQAERPDLVIVDWTLPGLTGPEICAGVRADAALDGTWLMMLTAHSLGPDGVAISGADEVVAKPFSPRLLAERVAAALAR